MSLSITDLLTVLTADQVETSILASMTTLGVNSTGWRKGGVYRTLVRAVAVLYAGFTSTMVSAIGAGFLETAQSGWLTLLALYVFNITRPAAAFATGTVNASNTGGGIYAYAIGQAQFINAVTGAAYTNSAAFTLNPGASAVPIPVVASVIGTVSNADPGTVTKLGTAMLGVTITNPAAIVGNDAMLDADLRALCSNKLASLSNGGPRGAYLYAVGAATRPGGTPVNINRVSVSPSSSVGVVTIFLAAPSGVPDPNDVIYATTSVNTLARPDGVTVVVSPVTAVPIVRTLTLWSTGAGGVTAAQLIAAANTALIAAISTYPIGGFVISGTQGYLFADFIKEIAKSADPSIFHVDDGGAADTALNAGQVATLAPTINVRIVTPS